MGQDGILHRTWWKAKRSSDEAKEALIVIEIILIELIFIELIVFKELLHYELGKRIINQLIVIELIFFQFLVDGRECTHAGSREAYLIDADLVLNQCFVDWCRCELTDSRETSRSFNKEVDQENTADGSVR
jgi:hypothetical protein